MLLVDCPNCGSRNALEFTYWSEGTPKGRPSGDDIVEWRRYLYFHANGSGWTRERWLHVAGCGRFVELERHRTTNELRPSTALSPGPQAQPA